MGPRDSGGKGRAVARGRPPTRERGRPPSFSSLPPTLLLLPPPPPALLPLLCSPLHSQPTTPGTVISFGSNGLVNFAVPATVNTNATTATGNYNLFICNQKIKGQFAQVGTFTFSPQVPPQFAQLICQGYQTSTNKYIFAQFINPDGTLGLKFVGRLNTGLSSAGELTQQTSKASTQCGYSTISSTSG